MTAAIPKGGYLAGTSLSFADLNVIPMLVALQRFPTGQEMLAKHPKLAAYIEGITARPSYAKTAPPPRR
jgi:glutathione S-transferase